MELGSRVSDICEIQLDNKRVNGGASGDVSGVLSELWNY